MFQSLQAENRMTTHIQNENERRWLILLIDSKVREFYSKFLLACVAAEAGFDSILGNMHPADLKYLPRGILFERHVSGQGKASFTQWHRLGYRVVAMDEEGLVFPNPRYYQIHRLAPGPLAVTDILYCWGDHQANIVREASAEWAQKTIITGNPRVDLLRKELRAIFATEADELRRSYGPFILINTHFDNNHFNKTPDELLAYTKRIGAITTKEDETFYRGFIEHGTQLYHYFLEMLPHLSRTFPKHTIILRPHQSENHDSWRAITAGLPNVRTIHQGPVIPWLMAADVLIHNSCTTGLEAYLLDRPVITYRPIASEVYDPYLPNAVSHPVTSLSELTDTLSEVGNNGHTLAEADGARRQIAASYISALDGPFAADRIVNALCRIEVKPQRFKPSFWWQIDRSSKEAWLKTKLATWQLVNRRKSAAGYFKQKNPRLEMTELQTLLAKLQAVTGRFSQIQVQQLDRSLFRVYVE
jgi:surface carbohydrate biosynthesis protein